MRRYWFILAIAMAASAASGAPRGLTRVLRTFDFEERRLGNAEDLPMHWVKVEGAGLPHYVNGKLSNDRAHSGEYSFRFDLNGGSLIYRYPAGQIPVQAGAHYRLEVWVQTTALPNARARMTAYFSDQDGHGLPNTITHSELYAAADEHSDWHRLALDLSATDPAAAFIVVELELLQPSQYSTTALGKRALFAQDIRGSAWFDDLSVAQVPEVTINTDRPGNIFRRDDPIRVNVIVNDQLVEDLSAQLFVRDADGRQVYQHSGTLDMSDAVRRAPGQRQLVLGIPGLRPGWYEISLSMSSGNKLLGSQTTSIVLLPDNGSEARPDPRFGIIATELPFDGWDELPAVLPLLSAGRVKLAVWSKGGDVERINPEAFDQLLQRLGDLGITPTACLADLPPAIAARLQVDSWKQLLIHDPSEWRSDLAYLVARHANHLDRWQLGIDGSDQFVSDPDMRRVYKLVYAEFANLIREPDLAMPWPGYYDLSGELPATVALSVSPTVLPSQLPLYIQDIRGHEGHNLALILESLPAQRYGRAVQIRDLAERVIYAISAGASRIDLPLPFQVQRDGSQLVKQPRETLMIMRTLITTLGGAEYKGKISVADGVEAFLFDRGGHGIIAMWDKGTVEGVKTLPLNLGDRAMTVDLWGNVTPLARSTDKRKADQVQLTVGPMPIFLLDIDAAQAQLRASVSFDRSLIESSFEPHDRRIRFINSYKTQMTGAIKLRGPDGWTMNPPTMYFSLNPGERFDRQVSIAFPYNSFAGPKTIKCDFQLQDAANSNFTVPLTLTLGLSDVGMQTIALKDGNDVLVQQMISNYGEKPIDYTAFAIFPGQPRDERLITGLAPGHTVMKRYRFKDVKVTKKTRVRVGVKELAGVRVLNDEVPVQ